MRYTVRPLSDRTWLGSMGKRATQFSATWSDTIDLLGREVDALKGRDVVVESDITEGDLKLNGELRANARPSTPAVAVAFESKHGPLLYRCDRFYTSWSHQGESWQHNVRAIALTLQALRAVDRYGATETGQQYQGFKQLGAGRAMPASHMTSDDAYELLAGYSEDGRVDIIRNSVHDARAALTTAQRKTHPDRHDGAREAWDQVEEAGKVIGLIA